MRTPDEGMIDSEGNISIPTHDIRSFSGLFRPRQKGNGPQRARGIGVTNDSTDGFFVASAPGGGAGQMASCRFPASLDGMKEWTRFVMANVPAKTPGIVCADVSFLRFLTDECKPERHDEAPPPVDELPNEARVLQFCPILGKMVTAYLSTLHDEIPDETTIASFLALVALDPLTHHFLTLTGMAHSAQDIIRFLRGKCPMDIVVAAFPNGSEMFILGRTEATPDDIDPAQFGLDYFSKESRHKDLPKPYRVKLAVLAVCKKHAITMGYSVMWQGENEETEEQEEA